MTSEVLNLLCNSMKLERDRGVGELQRVLPSCSENDRVQFEVNLLLLVSDTESTWETKHGCLLGAKALVPYINLDDEREADFVHRIKGIAEKLLTDIEVRVRMAAGEVLGILCSKIGSSVYQECKEYVLRLIQSNLERQIADDDDVVGRNSAEAAQIFHDTAGWKNLETSMKCLQAMIDGCGANFQPFVDDELLNLIFTTLTHTNRFVRETGYYVCASLVSCGNMDEDIEGRDSISEVNPIYTYGHEFNKHLAKGLADNWSQVRLAASVASRKFLMSLPDDKAREVFYPELLPRMCLNRYYVAEGVRIYSQETWRQVTGTAGKDLVQKYISYTVDYYIQATESDNHAVREAACACIAELASKILPQAVRLFVERVALPSLYPMFFRNLEDPIPSVRQGAASSLANVVRAYGQEALVVVMEKVTTGLKDVRSQPAESEKYPDMDLGQATFGVVKRLRDNDLELHSDKQMYSCGSLAPKMGRGGCSDHKFRRPSQPWEMADGCVYLLSELSQITDLSRTVFNALPLVSEACHYRHYAHHVVFLETVCKQLPLLAKGVGKKIFKSIVEEFLDPIFYALECENALTSSAASQCLNQIDIYIIWMPMCSLLRSNFISASLLHLDVTSTSVIRLPMHICLRAGGNGVDFKK
ncbi:hypothetical protein C0J52_10867 [Blattella germanica]|nr:hypothetical protein C0J52_10867 [Blattella germanica]